MALVNCSQLQSCALVGCLLKTQHQVHLACEKRPCNEDFATILHFCAYSTSKDGMAILHCSEACIMLLSSLCWTHIYMSLLA